MRCRAALPGSSRSALSLRSAATSGGTSALRGAAGGVAAAVEGGADLMDGRLLGWVVGLVLAERPSAEATTERNCFRSTGLVR